MNVPTIPASACSGTSQRYKTVDTDDGWTEPRPDGRQWWREDAIQGLLALEDADVLFIAGCEGNQPGPISSSTTSFC